MATIAQRSFSAGEASPALCARADLARYYIALKIARNGYIKKSGGFENRSGTEYCGEVKDSSKRIRYIPFILGTSNNLILEFGDLYMRVIKNGAYVKTTAQAITGVTNANPAVITYSGADTIAAGDNIDLSTFADSLGPYLNGRTFRVGTVNTGANTAQLLNNDGTNFNSTSLPAYTSGGQFEEIYTLTTTYALADLTDLKYSQSLNTITLTHPSYPIKKLTRTSDSSWTIVTSDLVSDVPRPTAGTAGFSVGANIYRYVVTAVRASDGAESLPWTTASYINADSITKAAPPVVTGVFTAVYDGDPLLAATDSNTGMTEINNRTYLAKIAAASSSTTTFQLSGEDSTLFSTYTDTGSDTFTRCSAQCSALALSTTNQIVLRWSYPYTDVAYYNIYRADSDGAFGFIGSAFKPSFYDIGYSIDYRSSFPIDKNPYRSTSNYPSVSGYAQQRLFFANTINNQEFVSGTKVGDYNSLGISSPVVDSDSVSFKAAGRVYNPVKHILDLAKMVVMTESAEIIVNADGSAITPFNINLTTQTYNGSANNPPPIVIDSSAIFVQAGGSIIRDLIFDISVDGYQGSDLTTFSTHLFEGYTIDRWTYQKDKNIVWCVRSDGIVLSLTYVKEQQMLAWTRHDFGDDIAEDICAIPNGSRYDVYVSVKRTINGATKRYTERLSNRFFTDARDYNFTDASLLYDGRSTDSSTMTLSGSGWTYNDILTLTASTSKFTTSSVGQQVFLYDSTGAQLRFTIEAYSSATVVTGRPTTTVPTTLQGIATSTWSSAVKICQGLWHLEGKSVTVTGDGYVVASPNNPKYDALTVTNGQITLPRCYSVIRIGLPFISDLETLSVEAPQGETLLDKRCLIGNAIIQTEKTRGMFVGTKRPEDDPANSTSDLLYNLVETKERDYENYDVGIDLLKSKYEASTIATWEDNGRVFIRQVDPQPMTILSISPKGFIPFKG